MRTKNRRFSAGALASDRGSLFIVSILVLSAGCSRPAASDSGADPHLSTLTKIYVDHMNAHQGTPPKDEATFKTYIRAHGAPRLKEHDVNEVDSLFISTRDSQPLAFVYATNPTNPSKQSLIIGYERSATDGKRTVGYRHGDSELVDEAKFLELAPAVAAVRK